MRLVLLYLASVHGLRLSAGEIVEVLHQLRRATAESVTALREEARASPVLHADETGWRVNGRLKDNLILDDLRDWGQKKVKVRVGLNLLVMLAIAVAMAERNRLGDCRRLITCAA